MNKKPYHNLIVWQEANSFTLLVYKKTTNFPSEERFGITSQLRRAATSVPTNIVEGYARRGQKDLARFINIAHASLAECEYLLELARSLDYLTKDDYEEIESVRARTSYLLNRFYNSLINL